MEQSGMGVAERTLQWPLHGKGASKEKVAGIWIQPGAPEQTTG